MRRYNWKCYHSQDWDNIYIVTKPSGRAKVMCRACGRARQKAYYWRQKKAQGGAQT